MGLYIAIFIIVALIVYSLKDVLSNADMPAWTNMVITALILFTVILSIFLILHRRAMSEDKTIVRPKQEQAQTENKEAQEAAPAPEQDPAALAPDQDSKLLLAEEYLIMEDYYKRNFPKLNSYDSAANYIMQKYSLTQEDWSHFLDEAAQNEYFKKAKEKMQSEVK